MTSRYAQLLFTPSVQRHQQEHGSRAGYEQMARGPSEADRLGPYEEAFIAARDTFYMATTSSTGWPYVQHRGGPVGFLHVVDDKTLAFADYRGNRQYITTGNLDGDDRVSLFLMDYPARTRLKILGRAHAVDVDERPELAEKLRPRDYRAIVERLVLIGIEAYDWNCPQHIQPRYTAEELQELLAPLRQQLADLQQENAELRERTRGRAGHVPG
ncbi:pyridoxamine 5'-phosphate oxidase family protein [Streptomyces sp. 8N616]|uniref:pyridoxamine 5'-phosphate oxidase family protein n=1 Tax=Streptomyces sp. 8N616 TaxID=3457414 RepID=UPI003FD4C3E2